MSTVAATTIASESDSVIATVLAYWNDTIHLSDRREQMEAVTIQIANLQESSLSSRKRIAASTKEFKALDNEGKLLHFGPIFKSYQEEIDSLTKRAKYSEAAYISLSQMLTEAPDPLDAMRIFAQKLQDVTKENSLLHEKIVSSAKEQEMAVATVISQMDSLRSDKDRVTLELESYKTEFTQLKNQDVTVKRLEEQLANSETECIVRIQSAVATAKATWDSDMEAHLLSTRERESEYVKSLEALRITLSKMQKDYDEAQALLFSTRHWSEEASAAAQGEHNMLASQLDSAKSRNQLLEQQVAMLESKIKEVEQGRGKHNAVTEEVLANFESERKSFMAQIKHLKDEAICDKLNIDTIARDIQVSQSATDSLAHKCTLLETELATRPRVEEVLDLKKQVQMWKAVSLQPDEDNGQSDEVTDGDMSAVALLVAKNRSLLVELTTAKNEILSLRTALQAETAACEKSNKMVQDQHELIQRLEEDVQKGSKRPTTGPANDVLSSSGDVTVAAVTNGEIESNIQKTVSMSSTDDMVQILSSQRDRFKARVASLEAELATLHGLLFDSTSKIDTLTQDNLQLFEKMRYLQSFRSSGEGDKNAAIDVEAGEGRDVVGRYRKAYEETVDPFSRFSRQERSVRYNDLNVMEKVLLSACKLVLGNKNARSIFFCYMAALHVLVIVTLLHFAHGHGHATAAIAGPRGIIKGLL